MDEPQQGIFAEAAAVILALQQRNKALQLASALREYKPPTKRRGAPKKHSDGKEEELIRAIDALCKHYGIRGERGKIPKLCRILNKEKPPSERLSNVEIEGQIKSLQNRLLKRMKAPK